MKKIGELAHYFNPRIVAVKNLLQKNNNIISNNILYLEKVVTNIIIGLLNFI